MKQILQKLPNESIIYFGDTARLPYGSKSKETIIKYSIENAIFLMEKEIKALVVACNTASAYSLSKLRHLFKVPVIGVIEPGAKRAADLTKNRKIAVLGTKGTIQSNAYQNEIASFLPKAEVLPIACPLFVPLVEEGLVGHPAANLFVREYLQPAIDFGADTILLGCTHYPLLEKLISHEAGCSVRIVDSAQSCADMLSEVLEREGLANTENRSAHRYFVSDDPEKFRRMGELFLEMPIEEVIRIPLH